MLHIWEVHRPYRAPPDFEKRTDRAGYEAAVTATDEWLAPVFEALGGNTLIVITGDHGESYTESGAGEKLVKATRKLRTALRLNRWLPSVDMSLAGMAVGHGFALHERLVRVPLIITGPGVTPISVSDQVRHIDLLPTMADIAGIDAPQGLDGRSLRPLIDGGSLPEESAYMEAVGVKLEGNRIAGARTPDWKLLRRGDRQPALYKLDGVGGPDEKRNVINRYPEVAQQLDAYITRVNESASQSDPGSGMTGEEEALVEKHLRDLGYL
jgi:arylsulfatase A-like enzyme